MVAGRPHQGIGNAPAGDNFPCCSQGAIHPAPGGNIGLAVQGRKGVDAVVTGPHRQFQGRFGPVTDGKHVGIDRFVLPHQRGCPFEIAQIAAFMYLAYMVFREISHLQPFKESGWFQGLLNGSDTHRRFHIATLVDVVDFVLVSDHQGDFGELRRVFGMALCSRGPGFVARRTQTHRIFLDGIHHHAHIFRAADIRILALKNTFDHLPEIGGGKRLLAAQAIENQVGRIVAVWLHWRFIGRVDDGARAILLVKTQAGLVLGENFRVVAQGRVIGQTFHEDALCSLGERFAPQTFVQGRANAATA